MTAKKKASAVFVHEKALCDSAAVGAGTRIWAFAHVMAGARIGRDCNIGEGCFVENAVTIGNRVIVKNGVSVYARVVLEDDVFVGPNAVFTNDLYPRAHPRYKHDPSEWLETHIHRGATLGANCTIICGCGVGAHAMVAAGAVVTKDVPPFALVAGVPAKAIGTVCYCGQPIRKAGTCACGARLQKATDGQILPVEKK